MNEPLSSLFFPLDARPKSSAQNICFTNWFNTRIYAHGKHGSLPTIPQRLEVRHASAWMWHQALDLCTSDSNGKVETQPCLRVPGVKAWDESCVRLSLTQSMAFNHVYVVNRLYMYVCLNLRASVEFKQACILSFVSKRTYFLVRAQKENIVSHLLRVSRVARNKSLQSYICLRKRNFHSHITRRYWKQASHHASSTA